MAQERGLVAFYVYCELCGNRLVVCHAFRIHAFCNAGNLLRKLYLLLVHNLEVADYVDSGFRSK